MQKNPTERSQSVTDHVALDEYILAIRDEFAPALARSGRAVLVNVDDLKVSAGMADAIGQIVRDVVSHALDHAPSGGGVVQVACGATRDGGITLEVTDDRPGGAVLAPGPSVADLVSRIGGRLTVAAANPGLRCTIVVPPHALV